MRYAVADITKAVILGRQGENEVTTIKFPIADWIELFGDSGVFSLLNIRPTETADSAYPCVVTHNDEFVYWEIKEADLVNKGLGKCELIYTIGEKVAKSAIFSTNVLESIESGSETPPEPYQDWVDLVVESGASAQESAENSEAYAVGTRNGVDVEEGDPAYHNNSKYYAELYPELAETVSEILNEIADIQTEVEKIDDKAEIFDLNVDNHTMQRRASVLYNLYLSHTKVFKYKGNLVIGATYDGSDVDFYYQESSGANAGKIFLLKVFANGMYGMIYVVQGNIHWHENKSVIDKLSDDDGELKYDGSSIGGVTDVQDEDGNSLVDNGIAVVPSVSSLSTEEMAQATSALADYVTINGAYFGTDGENIIAF